MDIQLLLDRLLAAAGLEDDVGAVRPLLLRRLERALELSEARGANADALDDIARHLEQGTPRSRPG